MSRPEAAAEPLGNAASAPVTSVQDTPVFAEPWQAEAFALVVALHERGLFSWAEWAEALSREVKKPGAARRRQRLL